MSIRAIFNHEENDVSDPDQPPPPDIPRAKLDALVAVMLEDVPFSTLKGAATVASQRRSGPTGATAAMVDEVVAELMR